MPNMFTFIAALLFASFVAGQKILVPSSTNWWVAQSDNVLTWECNAGLPAQFTVLINNSNPRVLAAPLAIIATVPADMCSRTIIKNEVGQPAGTGWTILLANPLNNTDVYVTSQEFEIKPYGSLYPSQASPSVSSAGPSPTPSGKTSGKTSGSISLKAGLGVVNLAAFAMVTLFA